MATGSFNIQVSGFAPARRDVELEITNETTGETRQVKPFLDGSATVRNLVPGSYAVKVLHPNVVGELVDMRRVQLFEGLPTPIRLPLPEVLFRDTPIRDTPLADLSPVNAAAVSARDQASLAGGKQPGDPIRSEDWNTLTGAVTDLANAVAELTRLVSPDGHDHPELEEKIDEVNGNVARFADQFGNQLVRLQRTLQTLAIQSQVDDALSQAGTVPPDIRTRLDSAVQLLKDHTDSDTILWGARKKGAYDDILNAMTSLRDVQPDPSPLEQAASFQQVLTVATAEATTPAPRTVTGEIDRGDSINAKTAGVLYYQAFGH
jgi:TolA-binding protein